MSYSTFLKHTHSFIHMYTHTLTQTCSTHIPVMLLSQTHFSTRYTTVIMKCPKLIMAYDTHTHTHLMPWLTLTQHSADAGTSVMPCDINRLHSRLWGTSQHVSFIRQNWMKPWLNGISKRELVAVWTKAEETRTTRLHAGRVDWSVRHVVLNLHRFEKISAQESIAVEISAQITRVRGKVAGWCECWCGKKKAGKKCLTKSNQSVKSSPSAPPTCSGTSFPPKTVVLTSK